MWWKQRGQSTYPLETDTYSDPFFASKLTRAAKARAVGWVVGANLAYGPGEANPVDGSALV